MDLLLRVGSDVEARRTGVDNATALMAAMAKNLTKVAQALYRGGADLFAKDYSGQSPYHLSVKVGHSPG